MAGSLELKLRHLITGGAGFVGSHLADKLAGRGDEVTLLDDLSTGSMDNVEGLLAGGRARLIVESADDPAVVDELIASADTCFHLASSVGVKLIVERPLECTLRNVRATDVVWRPWRYPQCRPGLGLWPGTRRPS